MSKKISKNQWFVLGGGGLLVLVCLSISLAIQSVTKNWYNQLISTDNNTVEFGDGAHTVPINSEDVLHVGEKSAVFGVEITLNNAGYIKAVENTSGTMDYWFVEFTGKNISDEIQYGVNPGVASQLQYLQNGNYIWDFDEFGQSQCDNEHVIDGFEIGDSFQCRLIYVVPADERNLYWVYQNTDLVVDGYFEERYAVFQIR